MIATIQQLLMARAALRLSQADVAIRAGISKTAFHDLESGASSPRAATLSAIQSVLEREGARFSADGAVRIVPKTGRWIIEPGQNPTPETTRLAMEIVNASRALKNLPLLRLDEDDNE
jgi:transcriptional regulator with XRE-family HTH domain